MNAYRSDAEQKSGTDSAGSAEVASDRRVPSRQPRRHGGGGDRHRRQARGGRDRDHRAAGRGPPAGGRRSGRRQDDAGEGARQERRLQRQPHPVHARPAAGRHHRRQHLQPGRPRVRVQARPGVREHRHRRRDQPRQPEDPVRPAREHGGAPGHRRRLHLPAARAVHRHRDAEPDRDGGHLRPPRGPARPLHGAHLDGLPGCRERGRDAAQPRGRQPARRSEPRSSPSTASDA